MNSLFVTHNQASILLLISALSISGCSDSGVSTSALDAGVTGASIETGQGIDRNTEAADDSIDGADVDVDEPGEAAVEVYESENSPISEPVILDEEAENVPETETETGDSIPSTDSILNLGNALDIWRETVSVINEDQLSQFRQSLIDDLNLQYGGIFIENSVDVVEFSEALVLDPPYQYESGFGSDEFVDTTDGNSYTCVSGGGVQNYLWPGGRDTQFNDCAVADVTYSGATGIRGQYRGSIVSYPFYDLTRVASDGVTTTLSGNNFGGNVSFVSIDRLDGWNDLNFRHFGAEEDLRLENFNIRRSTIDSDSNVSSSSQGGTYVEGTFVTFNRYQLEDTIEGRFDVFAPWAGTAMGLSVTVDLSYTDDVLVGREDRDREFPGRDPVQPFNWEVGNVTILAEDGSSMEITPSEAELGSFEIELSNGEVIGPLPWVGEYFIDRQ